MTLRPAMELDGVRMIASLAFDGYGPAILPATAVPGHLRGTIRRGAPRGLPPPAGRHRPAPARPALGARAGGHRHLGLVVSDPLAMPEGIHPT